MIRWTLLAFCFLLSTTVHASFPPRINVFLKEKMSCREIKKTFKQDRFHIHCDSRSGMLLAFDADYFGKKKSLDKVVRLIQREARVERVRH